MRGFKGRPAARLLILAKAITDRFFCLPDSTYVALHIRRSYTRLLIQSFAHKGLARFYNTGSDGISTGFTERIIGAAFKVHNALGPGFLEKVYENSMRIELIKLGIRVKQQEPINVLYDGQLVGEYYADLLIEDRLIVEVKAIQSLSKEHEVQLVNYLTATGIEIGLLINFGPSVQVRRKYREYRPRALSAGESISEEPNS
jgi:GxxExxY protein